ncbi:MAG: AAA family ATPase [Fimbriiglobus sp.]|nr:AAA family ATPase [Fimbriiglobus sp.]
MSTVIQETDLPSALDTTQAIEAAYSAEMAEVAGFLVRGLPVLVECEKELAPHLFMNVRSRLRDRNLRCIYLDGRPREADQQGPMPVGLIGTMIAHLREAVRGAVDRRVVVLPHLDLLTTSQGGLTGEAREVIPLLYENPELVWLGFKDPSFPLPKVIENLFPHRMSLLGIGRNRLRGLITQRESRKFGRQFNPWQLYKYVSGVNAVRLRKLLSTLEGEDYPADPKQAFRQLRNATLSGEMEIPDVDLDRDIGGYAKTKKQLKQEILDVLTKRDNSTNTEDISRLEDLLPKGMIFWGPPGTGKTFFAKAIATAIGAAITIVSGPELKSKWVGESEENLRMVFHKARQSAPAIIVFDELDSFATRRGTFTGSGVEHSMVNQLLTEMDGFHKEELVFIVGTTNFVESLDPALLRPGRFEFHLHIPYPEDDDRREILKIYDRKMKLQMTDEAMDYAVRRTGENFMTNTGTPFSGDHLNALCRSVARIRLRDNIDGPTTPKEVERGFNEYEEKVELTDKDAVMVATHEGGHFVCSLFCPHHPPPERVTIQSEMPWAPFYTGYKKDDTRKVGYSRAELFDRLCVLYGGIEAERLLVGDVSTGASGMGSPSGDLYRGTQLAKMIVEVCGMSQLAAPLRVFRDEKGDREVISGTMAESIDRQINTIVAEAQAKAAKILADHKDELIAIRDELVKDKTIEPARVAEIIKTVRAKYAAEFEKIGVAPLTPEETTPLDKVDKPAEKPAAKKAKPATGDK